MHRIFNQRQLIAALLLATASLSAQGAEPQGIWRFWPFRTTSESPHAAVDVASGISSARHTAPAPEQGPRTVAPANHQVLYPELDRAQPLKLSTDGPVIVGPFNPQIQPKIDPNLGPYPIPLGTPTA